MLTFTKQGQIYQMIFFLIPKKAHLLLCPPKETTIITTTTIEAEITTITTTNQCTPGPLDLSMKKNGNPETIGTLCN